MSLLLRNLSIILAGLLLLASAAASAPPAPTAKQINTWVRQLGDNDFSVREEASRKLWQAGAAAEAALEEAVQSEDPEVVRRARAILGRFRWGIYPDTPGKVVDLINSYRAAEPGQNLGILNQLFKEGAAGRQAAIRFSMLDDASGLALKATLFEKIAEAGQEQIAANHFDEVESLVSFGVCREAASIPHYVACWALQGKLDQAVAHYQALLREGKLKRRWEVLAYLQRARGDLAAAREAAQHANDPRLVDGLLYEAGDWKALAGRSSWLPAGDDPLTKLGYAAAFARLAGDKKQLDARVQELREQARNAGEHIVDPVTRCARILLLNDRPDEALQLLAEKESDDLTFRVEILFARLQLPQALAILKEGIKDDRRKEQRPAFEILQARLLHTVGEKDSALAIFTRYGDQIKMDQANAGWWLALLEAEQRCGLDKLAHKHCARMLAALSGEVRPPDRPPLPKGAPATLAHRVYLSQLFPDRENTAALLYQMLRQLIPGEKTEAVMDRLVQLLEGKKSVADLRKLLAHTEEEKAKLSADILATHYQALGEAALAARQEELAVTCMEKAGTGESLTRLGDYLAENEQWQKAALRYRQAWQKQRKDPLPLLLAGRALQKAGQREEGKRLCEQAHWLPLGDVTSRYQFLRELAQRRLKDDADRETHLLLAVSEPESYHSGAARRQLALLAAARKDYLEAARGQEVSLLRCLQSNTTFVQPAAYVSVPALVHRLRALGLLAAGKMEDALAETLQAQHLHPANLDLPIALVPELEKHGRKKEADQLYRQSLDVFEKLCQEHPRFAHAHNSAAWLSACCRRDLDRALAHARRAVELDGQNASYIDTLAEVHFQRGESKEAAVAQKRAIALDPKKPYYRQQLKRLEAGNPAAPRPAEDEEE